MALWGNLDNKGAGGTVSLDYTTGTVTGTGTTFGQVGAAATGDIIRFGVKFTGTYFGEAVIVGIASTTQLSIGRTCALSGAAIASTSFQISQLPKYAIKDTRYQHISTAFDGYVYGVSAAEAATAYSTQYKVAQQGWVGVTTYNDNTGALRVKTEVLVAMTGISTGNTPLYDDNPKV
jgi:hypothetical protein